MAAALTLEAAVAPLEAALLALLDAGDRPALVAGLHACVEPHLPRAASIDPLNIELMRMASAFARGIAEPDRLAEARAHAPHVRGGSFAAVCLAAIDAPVDALRPRLIDLARTLPQALWADGPDGRRFVARYGATRPFASVPEALAGIAAVAEGLRGRLPTP
ncbi:MAG: hypothetical protein H6706_10120 [Myxococcales bacterium]|nr:hypothetical protein [Myxococcales bacterium]